MQQKLIINRMYSVVCHLSSDFGTSTFVENPLQINPFYAKQTQFPKNSNESKCLYKNGLRQNNRLQAGPKQTQSNPIQTQSPKCPK